MKTYDAELKLAQLQRRIRIAGWQVGWLALVGISVVWHAWVLTVLWGWFTAPVFHAPKLSLAAAVGLSLIARLWSGANSTTDPTKSEGERFGTAVGWTITWPLIALGIGWLAHFA